jgi:ABC-type multidrug transport system ATPase subunit
LIRVVDVVHHYGSKPVLRGVNLHIASGEVMALMGPNGSGKSTLLALMAGALHPLVGFVEIDAARRRESREAELVIRGKVVYLPAEPWLPLNQTGRHWLLAVGRVWRVEDRRLMEHLDQLVGLFDLHAQIDSRINDLLDRPAKKAGVMRGADHRGADHAA